jgi:hypothetical protein
MKNRVVAEQLLGIITELGENATLSDAEGPIPLLLNGLRKQNVVFVAFISPTYWKKELDAETQKTYYWSTGSREVRLQPLEHI